MLRSKKKFIKMKLSTEKGGANTPTPSTRTQGSRFTPFSFSEVGGSGKGDRTISARSFHFFFTYLELAILWSRHRARPRWLTAISGV